MGQKKGYKATEEHKFNLSKSLKKAHKSGLHKGGFKKGNKIKMKTPPVNNLSKVKIRNILISGDFGLMALRPYFGLMGKIVLMYITWKSRRKKVSLR